MEIDQNIKIEILKQELTIYENTKYLLKIRYRVNKTLENTEAMKATEDELVKIERAIEELNKILDEETT